MTLEAVSTPKPVPDCAGVLALKGKSFPIETRGRVVDAVVGLEAAGDVLNPQLLVSGGFLDEGTARVRGPDSRWVDAEPLTLSGFIYGFRANVVLQPSAPLVWHIEGRDTFGRELASDVSLGDSEPWPKLDDATFEAFESGEKWGSASASIEERCDPNAATDAPPLPPIPGARSLVISDYRDRFRFSRRAKQTQLSFVAFGKVGVELATVGALSGQPFQQEPTVTDASCLDYPAFCANVPTGSLKLYSVLLPPGDSDVLLRLTNEAGEDFATGPGTDLCVDELRLQ